MRFGLAQPVEVPASERAEYWKRIKPYVRGDVQRNIGDKTTDHFDYEVREFRDAERRVLVTVYEMC